MTDSDDDWRRSTHEDIASLTARQHSTEQNLGQLRIEVRGVISSIDELGKELRTSIGAINASKSTDWKAFYGSAAAVITVAIMIGAAVITPLSNSIGKNEDRAQKNFENLTAKLDKIGDSATRHDDFMVAIKNMSDWAGKLSDRQRDDELNAVRKEDVEDLRYRQRRIEDGYVTEKQLAELKDRVDERYRTAMEMTVERLNRLDTRTDTIDGSLVKRPEIAAKDAAILDKIDSAVSALGARLDGLGAHLNGTDQAVHEIAPPGDMIKEMWNWLRELRTATPPKP